MNILPRRILPVLFLATCALLARPTAADEPAQENFTGKFVCVEDADQSWPLSGVHLTKVGSKEFLVGDMVPPPEMLDTKEEEDAKKPAVKASAKPLPKHRRVMLPLDKVVDIQVFDTEDDLNAYCDSLDDGDGDEADGSVVY